MKNLLSVPLILDETISGAESYWLPSETDACTESHCQEGKISEQGRGRRNIKEGGRNREEDVYRRIQRGIKSRKKEVKGMEKVKNKEVWKKRAKGKL